jgi:hypothetical protein
VSHGLCHMGLWCCATWVGKTKSSHVWHHLAWHTKALSSILGHQTWATSPTSCASAPLFLKWLNSDMSTLHNASHTFSHPQFTLETFQVQQILKTAPELEYLIIFDHPTGHRTA